MHINDAVFLEDLCPKFRLRQWRKSIHKFTGKSCIYCGKPSESIDHVIPQSQGGLSTTENCVPACLSCNGDKSDENALYWYRRQKFYDPRRAMAIRAWLEGDIRLAIRLLQWANPNFKLKNKNYGKLSNQNIQEQNINQQGRMDNEENNKKLNPQDFALWKKAKDDEPYFDSPWGRGRPGWHIECSAMVKDELGDTIDIHLGGSDLIFPHHENEIAQSEAANGKKLANYWLHNGMVNVNGQKMRKSLKNFKTIRELIKSAISTMTLRYFDKTVNYRKPLDFTEEALRSASEAWKNINVALSFLEVTKDAFKSIDKNESIEDEYKEKISFELSQKKLKFSEALGNDLNTAGAIAIIYDLAKP